MERHCARCRLPGHRRDAARCILINMGNHIYSIKYYIGPRRIRAGRRIHHLVQIPRILHHAVVLQDEEGTIQEIGYGPRSVYVTNAGTYHSAEGDQIKKYERTDLAMNFTRRQIDNVVNRMQRSPRWHPNSYCCFNNNCVHFTRVFLMKLFLRVHGRRMPANMIPRQFRQYQVGAINTFLRTIRFAAARINHLRRHRCIAF